MNLPQQIWTIWRSEFEQRALLLHLADNGIRKISRSILDEKKRERQRLQEPNRRPNWTLSAEENITQANCQTFLTTTPRPGERINNFVTRLQTLAAYCKYNDENDNQISDRTLTFVSNKHLKAKLYQDTITWNRF